MRESDENWLWHLPNSIKLDDYREFFKKVLLFDTKKYLNNFTAQIFL